MSKIIAPHKVINKSSQLQSLLDDSNRLAPFILALLDDLDSRQNTSYYLRHLVKSYTEAKYPKHLTVFCLENADKEKFVIRNRILMNHNVTLVNEDDLLAESQTNFEFDLRNDEFLTKLALFNKPSMDNVLLLDSLVPLFMSQSDVSVETATKNICAWFARLQASFSHIIFVLHADFTLDRYAELALTHISSAIIDFRLASGLSVPACPATKLTQPNSIHCHVIAKKKHPRTHLKVARKHEHFVVDQTTGNITKHISSDELEKILANNAKIAFEESQNKKTEPAPESTFNLTLKKDEQEAKDSLILPYMRKNITTNSNSNINTKVPPVAGGLAANTTISTAAVASQITYHYDQFDDFDEDDPDDDLDF